MYNGGTDEYIWTRITYEHLYFFANMKNEYEDDPVVIKYVNAERETFKLWKIPHLFNLKIYFIRMAHEARELTEFENYLKSHESLLSNEDELKKLCPDWYRVMSRMGYYKKALNLYVQFFLLAAGFFECTNLIKSNCRNWTKF